jgi:hypothetical protein
MKHGSIQNLMGSQVVGCPVPEVGMGVTLIHYTDREAGTIIRVSPSKKTIWFQVDHAKRTDNLGMTDSGQKYEFTPNTSASEQKALLRNGKWKSNGQSIIVGSRDKYHDFSF